MNLQQLLNSLYIINNYQYMASNTKLDIAFIHPDLGIGGAEQLIINLALSLIKQGHQATIYTPYHKKSFKQTHDGTIKVVKCGTLFGIIPRSIFNRFIAILAYIRTIMCTLWMITYGPSYDLVVCDQVSVVVPILRLCGYKTIFYCHFPDKLLSGKRGLIKSIYRFFIDLWEQISLCFANLIYVNSEYTRGIFYQHFKILNFLKIQTETLYPAIDFSKFDIPKGEPIFDKPYFVSLNRYERKKNINLAIQSFSRLTPQIQNNTLLIIAGGYDQRVSQNVQHYEQLVALAKLRKIQNQVKFFKNVTDQQRGNILSNSIAVLYTPENQHFGIVPCQAMYSQVPVIASKSGGPLESIKDGETGFLIQGKDQKAQQQWANKMIFLIENPKTKQKMGIEARNHVNNKFGLKTFGDNFIHGILKVTKIEMNRNNKKQ